MDEKKDTPKTKKPEKDINEVLDKDGRMMRSPALWFFLLFIPVMISIYAASQQNQPAAPVAEPLEQQVRELTAEQWTEETPVQQSNNQARHHELIRGGPPLVECHFKNWVGQKPNETMKARLKAENRPSRILTPGAAYTKDFNPERVNLELNGKGSISRVWCG